MKKIHQLFSVIVLVSMLIVTLAGPGFNGRTVLAQDEQPTLEPTAEPTATVEPTAEPTQAPTDATQPTAEPTQAPTEAAAPTPQPTDSVSAGPVVPPAPVVSTDPETGQVRFMGGSFASPLAVTSPEDAASKSPKEIALGFLQAQGSRFGLADAAGLTLMKEESTEDGRTFERFQQNFQGVPVIGGELIVQLDASKNVISANGKVSKELDLAVTPAIDAAAAKDAALQATKDAYPEYPGDKLIPSEPELWIYDTVVFDRVSAAAKKLVWKVMVGNDSQLPVNEFVLVDAQSGAIARQFNTVDTVTVPKPNRTVIKCDLLNLAWYYPVDNYWLQFCPLYNGDTRTEGSYPIYDSEVNKAYDYLGDTYYFYNQGLNGYGGLNRNSINGKGMKLLAFTNVHDMYNDGTYTDLSNAYWDGKEMVFGTGYISTDVTAHELTHGVTEYTSKLIYVDQSGAINESMSDIFGELVEKANNDAVDPSWLIAEDLVDGPFRSMSNPPDFGDPDSTGSGYYCGFGDNGGVHTNSGVGNKAGYLIASSLGITKTAKLYYEVQTHLLTSTAEYPDLADALVQAANNLYPSILTTTDVDAVRAAVLAVRMNATPCVGQRGYINPIGTFAISPVGTTGDNLTPTFTWRLKGDSTAYQLLITDSHKKVIYQEWLNTSGYDGGSCLDGTCTKTLDFDLKYGEKYSWQVQTRNMIGLGPWSSGKAFIIPIPVNTSTPIDKTGIVPAPDDAKNTALPEFDWNGIPGASAYVLKVNAIITNPKTLAVTHPAYLSMTVTTEVACGHNPTCKIVKPSKAFKPGLYEWSVAPKYGNVSGPDWAPFVGFSVNSLPAQAIITAPAEGSYQNVLNPPLSWNEVPYADSYIVAIAGTVGKVIFRVDASDSTKCSSGTCTVTPQNLEGGKQSFTVQALSGVGAGPASLKRTFNINPPQTAPVQQNPLNGNPISNNRPIFQWTGDALATSYTLQLTGPMGVKKVYKPADVCSGTDCSVRLDTTLKATTSTPYSWTVTATNKGGSFKSGAWTFFANLVTPPGVPVLSAPTSKQVLDTPAALQLGWYEYLTPAVDEFIVQFKLPNKSSVQTIVKLSDVCDTTTSPGYALCSWTYPTTLPLGTYSWSVTAVNQGVLGKPSSTGTFRLALPAVTNVHVIADNPTSDYQLMAGWNGVTGATGYSLQLSTSTSTKPFYSMTLPLSVCSGTPVQVCSAPVQAGLGTGDYLLTVTALHATGAGLMMAIPYHFSFSRPLTAEFNNNLEGWYNAYSDTYMYPSGNKYATLTPEYYSAQMATDGNSYDDLDFQTYVQHTGDIHYPYNLTIRASFNSYYSKIATGYEFMVEPDGWFAVLKHFYYPLNPVDKQYVTRYVQNWAQSKAIKKGSAWNKLRVVASGNTFRLYVNDVLIWIGSDLDPENTGTIYGSGQIGIGTYARKYGEKFNIDWVHGYTVPASLASISSMGAAGLGAQAVGGEMVSPEQQALNDAANKEPSKHSWDPALEIPQK